MSLSSEGRMRLNRMIFHLLKYPIETNYKIRAICNQSNANEAYKGKLLVANVVTQATLKSGDVIMRAGQLIVPSCGGCRSAWYQGSKEIVEA